MNRKLIFHGKRKLYEIQISVYKMSFHWNAAMVIHLCIFSGCSCATMAGLSSWSIDCGLQSLTYLIYLAFYRKELPDT
jgi:hypothetical protein